MPTADIGCPVLLFNQGLLPNAQGSAHDANGEKTWLVFTVEEDCTIDRVTFKVLTFTSSGDYKARIETVDTAGNGQPTGTLLAVDSESAAVTITGTGHVHFDLITPVAVTRGQVIAVAFASVGTGNINLYNQNVVFQTVTPTGWSNISGSMQGTSAVWPLVGIRKSTGDYMQVYGTMPNDAVVTTTVSTTTTPDEVGMKITVPFGCRVRGLWVQHADGTWPDTNDFVLYDESNNVLATKSVIDDMIEPGSAARMLFVTFDTKVDLAEGQTVRAVIKPTSASTTLAYYTVPLLAGMDTATPHGGQAQFTSRTDGGAWTDTDLTYSPIGLVIDGVITPESGGGGAPSLGGGIDL